MRNGNRDAGGDVCDGAKLAQMVVRVEKRLAHLETVAKDGKAAALRLLALIREGRDGGR